MIAFEDFNQDWIYVQIWQHVYLATLIHNDSVQEAI